MYNNYDLLIIGNGFDRNLDLPTDYDSFLKYGKQNGTKNNLFLFILKAREYGLLFDENWNSFEKIICNYLNFIEYLFTNLIEKELETKTSDYSVIGKIAQYSIFYLNLNKEIPNSIKKILKVGIYLDCMEFCETPDGHGRYHLIDLFDENNDESLNDRYVFIKYPYDFLAENVDIRNIKKIVLDEVEKDLEDLELKLSNYIKHVTSDVGQYIPRYKFEKCMSFNYSTTAQELFGFNDKDICYVHGRVDQNCVIGIEDNMIENQIIKKESDYKIFYKQTRRSIKNTNIGLNTRILHDLGSLSLVMIFGHSLDKSDRSLLKEIFDKNVEKIEIYCRGNLKTYKYKLMEIIGVERFEYLNASEVLHFVEIKDQFYLFDKYA